MPNYNYKPIDQLNENMENLDQKWFKPKIDLKLLKELSKRRDGPGWINTIAYLLPDGMSTVIALCFEQDG